MSKNDWKQIARERIGVLIEQAQSIANSNLTLANRYVTLARKLSMRYKVRIPIELKRRFCKHCYAFLRSGVNARVRVHQGRVIVTCFSCKKFMRFPIKFEYKCPRAY